MAQFVTVELTEGLGNRLFRVSAAMGYAERWNMKFVFVAPLVRSNPHSTADQLAEICALYPSVPVLKSFDSTGTWTVWADHPLNAFTYAPFPDKPSCNVILKGYFQSDRYWPGVATMPTLPQVKTSIDFSHMYFIHVRLGDYVGTHHEMPLDAYYAAAVAEIRERDVAAEFLLISDDMSGAVARIGPIIEKHGIAMKGSASDTMNRYPLVVPTARLTPPEWLWIMSQCAGGICANSTFSWWGAACGYAASPGYYIMPRTWIHPCMGEVRDLWPSWAIIL